MPFSVSDHTFLTTHGFIRFYDRYRDRLFAIAQGTYRLLKGISGLAPSQIDCEGFLEAALVGSLVFADIVVDLCRAIQFPNPRDPYWPDYFAGPVARYVMDREWQDIVI